MDGGWGAEEEVLTVEEELEGTGGDRCEERSLEGVLPDDGGGIATRTVFRTPPVVEDGTRERAS